MAKRTRLLGEEEINELISERFTIDYENDVGPDDDSYWQWWEVKEHGRTLCKCSEEVDAIRIRNALKQAAGEIIEKAP